MKKCRNCKLQKKKSEFGNNKLYDDGLAIKCRKCINEYSNNNYHKRKLRKKNNKKRERSEISYSGKDKNAVRKHIALKLNQSYEKNKETYGLELYGQGELFNYLKKNTQAKILGIDSDPIIGEVLKDIPNTQYTTIQNLCLSKRDKFTHINLDYCTDFNDEQRIDLSLLPNIMQDEGQFWITRCTRSARYEKGTNVVLKEKALEFDIIHTLLQQGIEATRIMSVKYTGRPKNMKTGKEGTSYMIFYEYAWKKLPPLLPKQQRYIPLFPTPTFITIKEMEAIDKLTIITRKKLKKLK